MHNCILARARGNTADASCELHAFLFVAPIQVLNWQPTQVLKKHTHPLERSRRAHHLPPGACERAPLAQDS